MSPTNQGRYRYTDTEIKSILKTVIVLTDTREQKNDHILTGLDNLKIAHKPMALSCGDYSAMLPANPDMGIPRDIFFDNDIIIERKANLSELAGNFGKHRERFKDEMIRSGTAKKYLLIEQGGGYAAILNGQYHTQLSAKSFLEQDAKLIRCICIQLFECMCIYCHSCGYVSVA